ncbi:hypothetical protein WICPIJ_001144 [Wickerhamomyces pijperi]|uniref:Uncharacterized protein n=1 Tax=Wickerhamomyces pijperi TaxID=599730 RepID=A0A9P8QC96_WICPI|nr:hypothetical protein WICPIJ_001144 [Wickerhamomyces pijperi]
MLSAEIKLHVIRPFEQDSNKVKTNIHCQPKSTTMSYAADDLDDGLEYQIDATVDVDEGVSIRPEDSDEEEEQTIIPTERKTENDDNTAKKRKKTNDKFKEKKRLKMEHDMAQKKKVATLNSTELAHHFTALLLKSTDDEATQLDFFTKKDFVDGSNYKEARTLDNFKDFTDKYNKGLSIILATSRVRIGDLYKSLGPKSNAIKIGKGYDSTIRADTKYIIGTVERVLNMKLKENGHEIKSIFLDATYQDQKLHSVLDEAKLCALLKQYEGVKIILY